MNSAKVDFLYLGPDKAGSSWIHSFLSAQKSAHVPTFKDIYFFDRFYSRGIEWYHSKVLPSVSRQQLCGELSHDYLFSDQAIERIYSYNSNMKLIVCARDPAKRAFSHYLYLKKMGLVPQSYSFLEALEVHSSLVINSKITAPTMKYIAKFGFDNVLVLPFSLLEEDPSSFAKCIGDFLELRIDDEYIPHEKVLGAARSRWPLLTRFLRRIGDGARSAGFPEAVGAIKANRLITRLLYSRLNQKITEREYQTANELYFKEELVDIRKLF